MITGTMIYNKALSDAIAALKDQRHQTNLEWLTLRDARETLERLKK